MADWPDTDLLKQVLGVDDDDLDDHLDGVIVAAILRVQMDVGNWDPYVDVPDDMLSKAALRMAELIATRIDASAADLGTDKAYAGLLKGHRRVFGMA